MLEYALPHKTNEELGKLLKKNDLDTIIFCHIKLAYSLARKFGKDDEYFDAAIFGLVLGVNRLNNLKHDNITGYLVHWINRYLREVPKISIYALFEITDTKSTYTPKLDIDNLLEQLPQLDQAIISMKSSNFTNEEICKHLETTQWFIAKAKSRLKKLLNLHMVK